jgi:hypothetical protein
MSVLDYLLTEIEHCCRYVYETCFYEVIQILYATLRSLRTLYYDKILARHWDVLPSPPATEV